MSRDGIRILPESFYERIHCQGRQHTLDILPIDPTDLVISSL